MKNRWTAIIGMSLWNSYFSEENIGWIVDVAQEKFEAVKIMIPDYPTRYTYRALWKRNIEWEISKKWNALRNRIKRVLGDNTDVIDWKEYINSHPSYIRAVRELLQLTKQNEGFRRALEDTTKEVLVSKVEIDSKKIQIGTKFLICELAFLISAKEILGTEVTYVYHRPWKIFTDLISGKFDGKERDIDFKIIAK
jgi:cyclo(L-tyrosyl-L-tyrosyl) synthase